MSIKADWKYKGTVGPGSNIFSTQTGTVGYQVMLNCEDGKTTFTIWLTEKNKERAEKYLCDVLGVSKSNLGDPVYIENALATDIEGREVSFGTKEEDYNGKKSVKVAWIGKPTSEKLSNDVARFFGGDPLPFKPQDDDIPF